MGSLLAIESSGACQLNFRVAWASPTIDNWWALPTLRLSGLNLSSNLDERLGHLIQRIIERSLGFESRRLLECHRLSSFRMSDG